MRQFTLIELLVSDRDYRHSGGLAVAGGPGGPRGREACSVSEQSQANRLGRVALQRRQPSLTATKEVGNTQFDELGSTMWCCCFPIWKNRAHFGQYDLTKPADDPQNLEIFQSAGRRLLVCVNGPAANSSRQRVRRSVRARPLSHLHADRVSPVRRFGRCFPNSNAEHALSARFEEHPRRNVEDAARGRDQLRPPRLAGVVRMGRARRHVQVGRFHLGTWLLVLLVGTHGPRDTRSLQQLEPAIATQ